MLPSGKPCKFGLVLALIAVGCGFHVLEALDGLGVGVCVGLMFRVFQLHATPTGLVVVKAVFHDGLLVIAIVPVIRLAFAIVFLFGLLLVFVCVRVFSSVVALLVVPFCFCCLDSCSPSLVPCLWLILCSCY
jgi:hypothetical protein